MIYMYTTKLQGLYQNNVNSRTISITVKWAKEDTLKWNCNSCYTRIWLLAIEPTQQSQIPFVVSGLNESVYILTSFRLGICSSACPFKLISNTCRQSDSLHLSSWKLLKRMEKWMTKKSPITITPEQFLPTQLLLAGVDFLHFLFYLKTKKKMLSAVVACRIKTNEKQSFLYLRSLVRLSLQFSLRSVKTAHVFLLAFSC